MENIHNNSLVRCGNIVKSRNGDNLVGKFRGKPLWLIFEKTDYDEQINSNFPNEYYKSKNHVPKYRIHKNRKPAGYMFPRKDVNNNDFLFCLLENSYKKYYIFDLEDNLSIKENGNILFDIKGDFYNDMLIERERK